MGFGLAFSPTELSYRKMSIAQYPIHTAWAVSIALKSTLAFLAPSRLFRAWIVFCLIGSLLSWWVGFAHPAWYPAVWSTKAVLLCAFSAVIVAEACNRTGAKMGAGRFTLCAAASLGCYAIFAREPRWPESSLEAVFSITALVSLFLALVLVVELNKYQENFWWRYSAILCAYLMFDALCLFPASEYIETIGVGVGIWTSICYGLWILNSFTNRERLHRKPARLSVCSERSRYGHIG